MLNRYSLTCLLLALPASTVSANSPWGYEEGVTSVSYSYVSESFDEIYKGTQSGIYFPEVNLTTHWFYYGTGLSDTLTLSVQTGYVESENVGNPENPYVYTGLADTLISVKKEVINQYMDDAFATIAYRIGVTVAGNYGRFTLPHAPGDGANGVEVSGLMGRFATSKLSLQAEFGFRLRLNDTPDEIFYSVGANYYLLPELSFTVNLMANSPSSGTDITDSDFKKEFYETKEVRSMLDVSVAYNVEAINLSLGYATVIDALETRNTAASKVLHFSLSYTY